MLKSKKPVNKADLYKLSNPNAPQLPQRYEGLKPKPKRQKPKVLFGQQF